MIYERTKNATRNMKFGILLKVYQMILPFLMRTVMIYFMGVQYVGLNSLFTSILQVLNLAESGVGSAMVYSMYKPIAENDEKSICAMMQLYKMYYRIIGIVIAVIGLLVTPVIPALINGTIPQNLDIHILYLLNLATTVFSYWLFSYKNSLLMAHQRNDVTSKISLGINTIQFLIQLLVIFVFKNYYLYLIVAILCQIVNNIITSIVADKMYPDYRAKGSLNPKTVKAINGRIKDLFISKLGGIVLNSVDTIVISSFLGLTVLAIYQNYYFILFSVCGILEILLTSITASLGNSYITESKEKNYTDFKKITFMFLWLTGMCTSCFLGLFQPFMTIWVGKEFLMPISVIVCMCIYFYLYEITRMLNVFKSAGGIWHEDRFRPLISAVVNLILNLILVRYIGIYGIVISTVVSLAIIEVPWLFQNIFTVMYDKSYLREYLKLHISWLIATIISCGIIMSLTYKVILSPWLSFVFFLICSVLIPNCVFLALHSRSKEFKLSIDMINRITHKKIPFIKNM